MLHKEKYACTYGVQKDTFSESTLNIILKNAIIS